jgi:O-antigen/teichoic acid export membrane protein
MTDHDASADSEMPRRTVGAGASITTAASIATAAFGGVLGILIARVLGPADTGVYNVAASSLFVLLAVAPLGVSIGATYRVSHRQWQAAEALPQLALAALAIGVPAAGIAVIVAALSSGSLFEGVPLGLVAIAAGTLVPALAWTFTSSVALALDRYELFACAPLVTNVVALALAAVLAPTAGVWGAVVALAAGHVVAAIWLLWWARTAARPAPGWLTRARGELRATMAFGLRSYLPIVFQLVSYRADLFVLNAVAAAATVGHYAVALLVTEVGLLLPRSLGSVVLPRVAALDREESGPVRDFVIVKSVRHAILLVPITCAVLVVGVLVIPLVFGTDYSDAVGPGLILVPGVAVLGAAGILTANVVAVGRPEMILRVSLLLFPFTLVLYLTLIPPFEIWGAAIASTAAYLTAALGYFVVFMRATRDMDSDGLWPGRAEIRDYRELWQRARARGRTP